MVSNSLICTQLNSKVTLVFALCSSTNQGGKSTCCLLNTTHLQTAMEREEAGKRKVKNMQAKALDTLNFPMPGMTT